LPVFLYLRYAKLVESPRFGFATKSLAAIAGAGFGILGVGAKTRDDAGKLTNKGWLALTGIVVAGVFALAASVNDYTSGKVKNEQERKRAERLLSSVQRGLYPPPQHDDNAAGNAGARFSWRIFPLPTLSAIIFYLFLLK